MTTYDWIGLGIYLGLFFGYHYTYLFLSHTLHKETREKQIDKYRQLWINLIIDRNDPTFGIQSLRNMIMTNTYLISLATILMGGIISVLFARQDPGVAIDLVESSDIRTYISFLTAHPAAIKIFTAMAIILLAIYNFTISLRILNNLNFTAPAVIKLPEARDFQMEQIRRQSRHFFTGIRALYSFFGPVIWIFDTTGMIIFTIITTIAFLRFDFLPNRKLGPVKD